MRHVDPRTEPAEYSKFITDLFAQHTATYREGRMTPDVYRATLFALGWRGQDIETELHLNAPDPKPAPREKYRVVGGKVVENR